MLGVTPDISLFAPADIVVVLPYGDPAVKDVEYVPSLLPETVPFVATLKEDPDAAVTPLVSTIIV